MKKPEENLTQSRLQAILFSLTLIKIIFVLYMVIEIVQAVIIPLTIGLPFISNWWSFLFTALKDLGLLCLAWTIPDYAQMLLNLLWTSHFH